MCKINNNMVNIIIIILEHRDVEEDFNNVSTGKIITDGLNSILRKRQNESIFFKLTSSLAWKRYSFPSVILWKNVLNNNQSEYLLTSVTPTVCFLPLLAPCFGFEAHLLSASISSFQLPEFFCPRSNNNCCW